MVTTEYTRPQSKSTPVGEFIAGERFLYPLFHPLEKGYMSIPEEQSRLLNPNRLGSDIEIIKRDVVAYHRRELYELIKPSCSKIPLNDTQIANINGLLMENLRVFMARADALDPSSEVPHIEIKSGALLAAATYINSLKD
jgi:hypothetical protein